jgi:hypothetical protein
MKLRVVMKCPDALEFAIENALEEEIGGPSDSEEHDDLFYEEKQKIESLIEKWFRYGEVLTVIVDTEEQTCIVEEA